MTMAKVLTQNLRPKRLVNAFSTYVINDNLSSPSSISFYKRSSQIDSSICTPLSISASPFPGNKISFKFSNSGKLSGRTLVQAMSIESPTANVNQNTKVERLVQHLLVAEDQLQLLLQIQKSMVEEGLDLSDLAEEHSLCPSKRDGGMLGWIKKGQTVPEFEDAAFNSPLNKVVRVKTKYGWHLIQALSEREASFLEQISPEDMVEKLKQISPEQVQLVDVRERNEIDKASVSGFRVYPLSEFGKWAAIIKDELDVNKDTFVMCHHGVRSQQAAEWLQSQGFLRLYNIQGGIDRYAKTVDSSIPLY